MTLPTTAETGERIGEELLALAEKLSVRRQLRFAGDCKCGSCQLVPVELLDEAVVALKAAVLALRTDMAEVERLREAMRLILPYLLWTISDESPGHHPTMPSAVAALSAALTNREAKP